MNASNKPAITMSSLDWERIDRLLENPAYSRMPGVDALQSEMDRAHVVEPTEVPPEVVTMNSTVEFINDQSGQKFEMTLVYPDAV